MTNTFRNISLAFILTLPFLFFSCLNTDDSSERNAATEQQEISDVVAKLTQKGYNIDTTALGSYYIVNKTGVGEYPQPGDTLSIIYTGFFLDGTIFDASYLTNNSDSIWKFVYKSQQLIPGFDEALSLLNNGAAADFIIPSKLAYGESGYMEIPPYTPLGFSIQMKNINPQN